MVIHSLYGLSAPSPLQADFIAKKVAICKEVMGDKWLLSTNVIRKDKK